MPVTPVSGADELLLRAGKDGAQGRVPVPVGHWLVRAPRDLSDVWPVDPDYFAAKYEPADHARQTGGDMKVKKTRNGSWRRPLGRLVLVTAAERQRPRVEFNRYPHEIIGVALYFGGRRYLSWVSPLRITDLRLTDEQFDRGVRAIDTTGEGS